jgi:outer membrane protein TolC
VERARSRRSRRADPVARGDAQLTGAGGAGGARACRQSDLGVAAARIQQARAQLRSARAESLPTASASLGIGGTASGRGGSDPFDLRIGAAGLDISWEADLFGRLSAGRRAAAARIGAAALDRDALALTLEGEVARAFVQHATLGQRLALLDRSLGSARELARIIEARVRHGASTRVESGAQAWRSAAEVERSRIEEARSRTRNALALLIGEEAPHSASLPRRWRASECRAALVSPANCSPAPGRRRPRRGSRRRRAMRAGARRFPAPAAAQRRRPARRRWAGRSRRFSIGADLLAPIFNRGRLRGQLDFASAVQRESVEQYRSVLLRALREAEDALAGTEQSRVRAGLLDDVTVQARETARLARLQYVEGVADLQVVIAAEERLIGIEDARAVAAQERLEAAIDLYRAMGGAAAPDARFATVRGG